MQSFCTHRTKSKVSQTIRFTIHTQISYTVQNEMAQPSGKRKEECCGVQPSPQYCACQKASVLVTGKLLHRMVLLAVLQTEGSPRKCLENIFKI